MNETMNNIITDPRTATREARATLESRELTEGLISEWVHQHTADEVIAVVSQQGIPCAKVSNVPEMVENEQLIFSKIAFARDVNLLHPNEYPGKFRANVKPRYGKREAAAVIYPPEDNSGLFCVEFEEPQRALTPGQSLVFYNGDELIGGGVCVLK